jgi:predicted flap endonuclease-1-like 5' DNA nuclease
MSTKPKIPFTLIPPNLTFGACCGRDQGETQDSSLLPWVQRVFYVLVAILAGMILGGLLLWWWLDRHSSQEETHKDDAFRHPTKVRLPVKVETARPDPPTLTEFVEAPTAPRAPIQRAKDDAEPEPACPDELSRVRGIGPKIADLLQSSGIRTYKQLAATDVNRLRDLLAGEGLAGLFDPTSWPEQARLAAEGEWGVLKALQEELRDGQSSR